MTPSPDPAAGSPLATLRQLKEMLDAGTITPHEFETLKQQLVFGAEANPALGAAAPAEVPPTPYLDTPAALTPAAAPLLAPEPDWLAAPAPPLLTPTSEEVADEEPAERRNPLNLVFALGGLLLFLGVVAYLTLGRPVTPDEHLTSTTQTAADTTATAPETGPQAEQQPLPPAAAPEIIRVAPAVVPVAAADSAADSVGVAPVAPVKAAHTKTPGGAPAKAAAPAVPAPVPADTAAAKP